MNTEQLAEIKARCDAATPGTWDYEAFTDSDYGEGYEVASPEDHHWIAQCLVERNADFIAHARADIPALLSEVERLRTALLEIVEDDPWVPKSKIGRRNNIDVAKRALGLQP